MRFESGRVRLLNIECLSELESVTVRREKESRALTVEKGENDVSVSIVYS